MWTLCHSVTDFTSRELPRWASFTFSATHSHSGRRCCAPCCLSNTRRPAPPGRAQELVVRRLQSARRDPRPAASAGPWWGRLPPTRWLWKAILLQVHTELPFQSGHWETLRPSTKCWHDLAYWKHCYLPIVSILHGFSKGAFSVSMQNHLLHLTLCNHILYAQNINAYDHIILESTTDTIWFK